MRYNVQVFFENMIKQPEIAKNLKIQRKHKGWSLTTTAVETGVSKAMLGQIERGESSPTIATLWKIAKGFHLPLTTFIENQTAADDFRQLKQGISFKTLFSFDPLIGSEMFLHRFDPKQSLQSAPHDKGVIEDVVVISGEIEVLANHVWTNVKAGNAFRFAADQPHGYRNPSSQITTFHNIMHYPNQQHQ